MKILSFFSFIIVVTCTSCMNLATLKTKELKEPYPTNHIFNLNIKDLNSSITYLFSTSHQLESECYSSLVFYKYAEISNREIKRIIPFAAENLQKKLFSNEFFSTSGNKYDIYLHTFGECWNSPLYYAKEKPLKYRAQFRLKLDSISPQRTRITVETEEPRVLKGISGIGHSNFVAKEIEVEPTTIEEYSILYYIGFCLSDTTLHPLNLDERIKN